MKNSNKIKSASLGITNEKIFNLICENLDLDREFKILDFGAGEGYMSQLIGEYIKSKGKKPDDILAACEIFPEFFKYKDIKCKKIAPDSNIPYDNDSLDLIYAIEVIEHTKRPYDFLEQAYKKLKPGGKLIFSVPNILHMESRIKNLFTGYSTMYTPLSSLDKNAGKISGHIMPLSFNNFHYGLRKYNFKDIKFHIDKRKKGATILTLLLYPFLKYGSFKIKYKLKKNDKDLFEENKDVLPVINSFDMLTSRSCIVIAKK